MTAAVPPPRRPSAEQARAIDLLQYDPERLTDAQWRHVDRVVIALGALGVPPPRPAPTPTTGRTSTR